MVKNQEVTIDSRYHSLKAHRVPGDFRFLLFRSFLSYENELPAGQKLIMKGYFFLKHISLSAQAAYGLDTSNVVIEDVPLLLSKPRKIDMERIPSELPQPN